MAQWHKYVYEVWPRDDMGSWPMRLPDHVVLYVRDGAEVLPDVEDGFITYRVSHVRSQCRPSCARPRVDVGDRVTGLTGYPSFPIRGEIQEIDNHGYAEVNDGNGTVYSVHVAGLTKEAAE